MNIEKPLAAAIKKPVATVLVYGVLLVLRLYALVRIPVEVLPRFDYPEIAIIVHYPGATTEDLENQVCRPLEGSLLVLPALSSLRSVMGQNTLEIDARFRGGSSAQMDLQATYSAIDRSRAPPASVGTSPRGDHGGGHRRGGGLRAGNPSRSQAHGRPARRPDPRSPGGASGQRHTEGRSLRQRHRIALDTAESDGAAALRSLFRPDSRRPFGKQVLLGPAGYLRLGHQDDLFQAAICLRGSTNSPRSPSPLPRVPFHCTPWRRYPSPPGPSVTGRIWTAGGPSPCSCSSTGTRPPCLSRRRSPGRSVHSQVNCPPARTG